MLVYHEYNRRYYREDMSRYALLAMLDTVREPFGCLLAARSIIAYLMCTWPHVHRDARLSLAVSSPLLCRQAVVCLSLSNKQGYVVRIPTT